mmetsp:Transcript_12878/g.48160  ORF Transcript_12878/g.48160 Transcript_12878/m.48160 type:complete len:224 (+) Transcript_12878:1282-1953(+)
MPPRCAAASSSASGVGSPAPAPAAALRAPPGIPLPAAASAAMSSSGSSISASAARASSLARASTSLSSRMVVSTSSVYLLSALNPLSGTMLENKLSPDASSAAGAGGVALTIAAAPSSGRSSYAGTRTMYTTSFSRVACAKSLSTVSFNVISVVTKPTLTPCVLFTNFAPTPKTCDARCRRAILAPTPSSSSARPAHAATSASAKCRDAMASMCARHDLSTWS